MRRSRSAAVLVLVLVAVTGAACSTGFDNERYVARDDKTFDVSGSAALSLTTFDGVIEVTSWDRPQVALTIERHAATAADAAKLTVTTEQVGNRIEVKTVNPNGTAPRTSWGKRGSVRFIVRVPHQTDLSATSGDGAISVTGLSGHVDVRSGDGVIAASDLSGDLGITTGDGAVTARNVSGRLTITTGDGAVSITGAPTILRARTGDGSVNVEVTAGAAPVGDWELTTGDGSVHIGLPATFNATVDLHTNQGGIDAGDWGLHATGQGQRDLRGTIGTGGALLKVSTGDGGISLTKR